MMTDLQYVVVGVSHTTEITSIAFGTVSSTIFATGTRAGDIRIWDITDYASLACIRLPKSGAVTSLVMAPDGSIISGWQDGFIRCHDGTLNRQLWLVPGAHRGATTTLAMYSNTNSSLSFLASGGDDGTVRVWRLGNRELVTQYTEHTKPVSKVLVDIQKPNILHSVGADGSVLSFDLKSGRRLMCHILNGGLMTDMTQRKDNELELITSDVLGRLMHWDIDYREAVLVIQDPTRTTIRKCSVSPSGRFLAFAGDDMVLKVLEIKSGQVISLGQGHSSAIKAISWTPDERQLVTGGDDCCLCVWNFYLGGLDVEEQIEKTDDKVGGR
jgi:WD40 repeat protein